MVGLKADKVFSFPKKEAECLGGHITYPLSRQSSLIGMSSIPMRMKLVALPELP